MSREEWWWWISAVDPETGKQFLISGARTEEEARSKGLEELGGIDFRLKRLPTRNLQRASSLWKGRRLSETHSLRKASERIGHERTVRRRVRRRPMPDWL